MDFDMTTYTVRGDTGYSGHGVVSVICEVCGGVMEFPYSPSLEQIVGHAEQHYVECHA